MIRSLRLRKKLPLLKFPPPKDLSFETAEIGHVETYPVEGGPFGYLTITEIR